MEWEEQLVRWILALEERGFPITPTILADYVQLGVTASSIETPFVNNR